MSGLEKKKRALPKEDAPASKGRKSPGKAKREKLLESEDIERAVYDGMQDLRVKPPKRS